MHIRPAKCFVWLFYLLFLGLTAQAQESRWFRGRVVAARTGEEMPFVHISHEGRLLANSAIDGRFGVEVPSPVKRLRFSFVGFRPLMVEVPANGATEVVIRLEEDEKLLEEVVVSAKYNPAIRIIEETIRNRRRNNPEDALESFRYRCYNKFIVDLAVRDTAVARKMEVQKDTSRHLLLMESYTERKWRKPDLDEEVVLSNRVSGFQDPKFSAVATDIQPFTFYQDYFQVINRQFLTPISPNSPDRYDFKLVESIPIAKDTLFVIRFQPQEGKNFDGLKGVLYIHSDGYAVQNVIAEIAEVNFVAMRIHQQYSRVDGRWFPEQLNFDLDFLQYPFPGIGTVMHGRSFLSQTEINPVLSKKDFGLLTTRIDERAHLTPDTTWNGQRHVPLAAKEARTLDFMDSLMKAVGFNRYERVLNSLAAGTIPTGPVSWRLSELMRFNQFEGFRLGAGLQTNERVSKHLILGGYVGYGFRDQRLKYGGDVTWRIRPDRDIWFSAAWSNDVREAAQHKARSMGRLSNDSFREFLAQRMDSVGTWNATLNLRPLRFTQLQIQAARKEVRPLYEYRFSAEGIDRQIFSSSEVDVQFRYAYGEKLFMSGGKMVSGGTKAPVLFLRYTQGLPDVLGSNVQFERYSASISKTFLTRAFGKTYVMAEGGLLQGRVPYSWLFAAPGGNVDEARAIFIHHAFQTMGLYEFTGNRYAHLFVKHDFGTLLLKNKYMQPNFSLVHASGFSWLDEPALHQGIAMQDMRDGFHESGLHIENILRFNYVNIAKMGIGGGVYYRYGAYSLPTMDNNFAYKLLLSFSF